MNVSFWVAALVLTVVCGIFESNQVTAKDRDVGLLLLNVTVAALIGAMHWSRHIEERMASETLARIGISIPPDPFNARFTNFRTPLLKVHSTRLSSVPLKRTVR